MPTDAYFDVGLGLLDGFVKAFDELVDVFAAPVAEAKGSAPGAVALIGCGVVKCRA